MSSYQKWKIKSEQIKKQFSGISKICFLSSSFINNDLLLQQVHFAGRISFFSSTAFTTTSTAFTSPSPPTITQQTITHGWFPKRNFLKCKHQ